MRVLIATNELQGTAEGDYAWTVEGELVTPVAEQCASSERCGCNRGFPGLASAHATTTAMVVDRPGVTVTDLRDAVEDYLDRGGWIELLAAELLCEECHPGRRDDGFDDELNAMIRSMIDEHVDVIRLVCASYELGTVVERDGSLIRDRSYRCAA